MTDSESDTSNVFITHNVTTVSAKGPNLNISNLSFPNKMTSTLFMPRNFERARYAESAYDQRSMYYRRENSPMSMHSACDIRPRNFQQYNTGWASQKSAFNGRSGSPMSMRSIDSSASLSAADIAFAFKNVKYNTYDLRVIKDAYQQLMKPRVRKGIEKRRNMVRKGIGKRRNMKLFVGGSSKTQSGDDSGELGSNSSLSDDDCRSIKTYRENMLSNRSTRANLSDYRKTVRDSCYMQDCSELRQNTFKTMFSVSGSVNNMQNINNILVSKHSNPTSTQKDRFRNGFLLPSQRFNQSVIASAISENSDRFPKNIESNGINNVKNHHALNQHNIINNHYPSSSEDEEIFAETTYNVNIQSKRKLDSEDVLSLPNKKKSKISSPFKISLQNKTVLPHLKHINTPTKNTENSVNFEFAKPALPIRKSKQKVQERLIAKSSQPLTDFLEPIANNMQNAPVIVQDNIASQQALISPKKSNVNPTQSEQSETTQISDVSMRPSFIKRKLFTQKLDVAEKANLSSDSTNSPQRTLTHPLQKEKNKARKLVTNQSCLNREVQDDSDLLDLIHKIVPLDRMNITNQTTMNQTKIDVTCKNKTDNEDKWDVTSVISVCNKEAVSDTYTDEEIFKGDNSKKDKTNKNINKKSIEKKVTTNGKKLQECKVMVENLQNNNNIQRLLINHNINLIHNNVINTNVQSSVKSFWDTDFESDFECQTVSSQSCLLDKKATVTDQSTMPNFKNPGGYTKSQVPKKSQYVPEVSNQSNNSTENNNTFINNTVDSMCKFNTSTLSIRTHRNCKKKNSCNETCINETRPKPDTQMNIATGKKKNNPYNSNNKSVEKKKSNQRGPSKNYIEIPKSKSNSQNDKVVIKSRSKSETKTIINKQLNTNAKNTVESPKNYKFKSKFNPETPSEVVNKSDKKSKSKTQNKSTDVKNKKQKQYEGKENKSKPNIQYAIPKSYKVNSPKETKPCPKTKTVCQKSSISKNKNLPPLTSKSILNNTEEVIKKSPIRRNRPLRSCRTPSQNRSIELYRSSQLNNTSVINRSLRSRVINLSSSIENITIKTKPRIKTIVNNRNISVINTRKSDVSFSLDKQTTPPKKNFARRKADFFKVKRKT